MGTKYTGSVVPTLNNAPANAWTTDAEKACHVGELYLVDSNGGGDAGKVYAFSEYGIHEPKNATITDGVAQFSDGGDNLPMSKAEVTLAPSQNGTPWISTTPDIEPYLYRALPNNVGNSELDTLVGGTINWNQLVEGGNFPSPNTYWTSESGVTATYQDNVVTISSTASSNGLKKSSFSYTKGNKLLLLASAYSDSIVSVKFGFSSTTALTININSSYLGTWVNGGTILSTSSSTGSILYLYGMNTYSNLKVKNAMIFDLTAMFGSSIADYIYTLESGTAGAGVAWFRKLFPKPYYAYDAGSLLSVKTSAHKITGKNLFDPSAVTSGKYIAANGSLATDAASGYSTLITIDQATYIWSGHCGTDGNVAGNNKRAHLYDFDGNWIKQLSVTNITKNTDFTISLTINDPNARFLRLSEWTSDTNVMLEKGVAKTTYEAYNGQSYSLDSDLELRGIPKLDANNNLYFDGDIYPPSGNVTRKYGTRAYQSGDESLADAITDGTNTVYKLNSTTTESADPYTSPQSVSDGGTEEYVDSRSVPMPVGHRTYYANIVPITGETGATLVHTGVNLLGGTDLKDAVVSYIPTASVDTTNKYVSFASGSATVGGGLTEGVPFKENTRYTFIMTIYKTSGTGSNLDIRYTDGTHALLGAVSAATTKETIVFVSAANKTVMGLYKYYQSGYTRIYYEESGIFEGVLTASQFKEYQGTTYNVTFTDQGTVYGGTYDFVNGTLKVTHGCIASYNGETIGTPWLSSYEEYSVGATPTTGAQVVYPLASPQTYTLTPNVINSVIGQNYVWTTIGELSGVGYQSDNMIMTYGWLETWTMPKITKSNGTVVVLPYPQEYTPEIYDVDAATTGRNAAGTMIRDRVARKHKFNYKWAALSQSELSEILDAIQGVGFTLTTADPETGAKTNYTVYPGNRSMPVYWYPTPQSTSWMYQTLAANLIEM